MDHHILKFGKDLFVTFRKEDINNYYEFVSKELGRGAFGIVYRGRLRGSQVWRAIKKIPKAAIKDPNMLLNEVDISVRSDNPNIINTYEVYEYNQAVYLVTDICEGGQLFDRLDQSGSLSEKQSRIIFRQMVEAINYLHLSKIAHRDLKPENFLFMKKGQNNIKLIDFGSALRWETSLNKQLKKRSDKKIVGTSSYLAPEILNFDYDQRCDIWSLGVILYVLLTAVPPFYGKNDKEIMKAVKEMNYSMNIPQFDSVSKEARDLISRMLKPADTRITLKQIFEHPWMCQEIPSISLKRSFKQMRQFSKFNKLKKLTATFVASQMSESQVEKLGQLFRSIDINHDGFITVDELKLALADEVSSQNNELRLLMDSIDTDINGKINYTQFLASAIGQQELFRPQNLLKMFKLLDRNGNGEIETNEMVSFFSQNSIDKVNGKVVDEIIKSCDRDNSGTISFEEFQKAILF